MSEDAVCEYCGKTFIVEDLLAPAVCEECLDDELNQPLSEEKIVRLRRLREKEDSVDRKSFWFLEDDDAPLLDEDLHSDSERDSDWDFDHDYERED